MILSSTLTVSPQITFVCCVESGALEGQTVRMVESLRRWGGQFANAPLVAVSPRLSSPLSRETHRAFERLQVEYLSFHAKSKYSWFGFMNKPYALAAVEELSTSECIGWLDSDILFLGEPDQLILNEGEDFRACCTDDSGGTTGPEHPSEPYWKESCQAVGIDNIEDFPWITAHQQGTRIRLYWNSGVFIYRRSTNLANHYLQQCTQLLNTRIANKDADIGIFFTDQVALVLTVVKMGLLWQSLPYTHNYPMQSLIHGKWYNEEQLKAAKILHYHDCMWPDFWPEFIKCLDKTHPSVADWLSSIGPMQNEAPLQWRITNKLLKDFRSRKQSAYKKLCRVI